MFSFILRSFRFCENIINIVIPCFFRLLLCGKLYYNVKL